MILKVHWNRITFDSDLELHKYWVCIKSSQNLVYWYQIWMNFVGKQTNIDNKGIGQEVHSLLSTKIKTGLRLMLLHLIIPDIIYQRCKTVYAIYDIIWRNNLVHLLTICPFVVLNHTLSQYCPYFVFRSFRIEQKIS